jgi:anti-sigma factor RsiW
MSLDESTLLAYVDGHLPAARRLEIEQAVAADPLLAQTLHALRASQLPYAQAFEQQPLAALPAALSQQVAQLLAARAPAQAQAPAPSPAQAPAWLLAPAGAGDGVGDRAGDPAGDRAGDRAGDPAGDRSGGMPPTKRARPQQVLALLAALALAALLGWWAGQASRAPAGPAVEPWVRMVSSYHLMYGRETVLDGGVGLAQVAALKARLRDQHQLELKIPDLQAQGLQFVRAQQLQLDGKMVLQLVYLPADGLPVALCLTPAAAQAERVVSLDGQTVATWFAGGWAYLLVGHLPAVALQQLRSAIPAPVV